MKKIPAFIILFLAFPFAMLVAEYGDNIKSANAAYTSGDFDTALMHYKQAFMEKPNQQLSNFIIKLQEKVNSLREKNLIPGLDVQERTGMNITPGSIAAVTADISLAALAVTSYFDFNKSVDDYNVLYSQIDNTTAQNYNRLVAEAENTKAKGNSLILWGGLACAALGYTLADIFFIHAAFPVSTAAVYDHDRALACLTVSWGF